MAETISRSRDSSGPLLLSEVCPLMSGALLAVFSLFYWTCDQAARTIEAEIICLRMNASCSQISEKRS